MNSFIHSIPGWIISLALFLTLLPAIILILLIVAIVTRQFPVYRQQRSLALGSGSVYIYKIRTIKGGNGLRSLEEKSADVFHKDEYRKYVPLFCRWLRKSGIDEILQLVNVLKGEMNLIGPRPLTESDLMLIKEQVPEINERRAQLKSKPGITGCWQVWMDRDKGPENMIELDIYYEKNKSLGLDMKIVIETLRIIIFSLHSDSILGMRVNADRLFKVEV